MLRLGILPEGYIYPKEERPESNKRGRWFKYNLTLKKVEKDSIMGPGIGNTVIRSIPNLFNDHLFERLFLQQA